MGPVVAHATEPAVEKKADSSNFVCPKTAIKDIYKAGGMCLKEDTENPNDDERKNFTVSIMEEGFGKDYELKDKGKTISEVRTCFRTTQSVECTNSSTSESISKDFTALTRTCPGDGYKCQKVTVLLGKGGVSLIQLYVGMIYRWAATMAGIVCVLIMIVSGIQITASGGDTTGVDAARKRITQSLMALAVLFLSALILYMINPNFFTR